MLFDLVRITIFSHPMLKPLENSGWCQIHEIFEKAMGFNSI